MRARFITFRKPHEIDIEEVELPEPNPNQILIKTNVTLISAGTELTALTGAFPSGSAWSRYVKYPFRPGYSNVGVVVKTGSSVRGSKEGDRVATMAPHSDYAIVDAENAMKIPEGISDEEATFHTLASGVMNSVRLARISLGESVVVIGVGLLGQLAVQFCRLSGAYPVIAVDLSAKRLGLAEISGATTTIQPQEEDVFKKVSSLTKGRMADVVFEVTGNPDVIPWAIRLLRRQGRLIILSSPRGPTKLDFHDEVNAPSRMIIGTHFSSQPVYETPHYPWTRLRNTELFFDLLSAGLLKVRHLITHIIPWHKAREAYELLMRSKDEALGVLLDFRH